MFFATYTIAKQTAAHALRQPICLGLAVFSMGIVLSTPLLAAFSMEAGDGDNRMLVDIGLGNLWLAGMLLAAFLSTSSVASEFIQKTALMAVTKPVPRVAMLLGKWLGVCVAVSIVMLLNMFLFTLLWRHRVLQNAFDTIDGPVWVFGVAAALFGFGLPAVRHYLYHKPYAPGAMKCLFIGLGMAWLCIMFVSKEWQLQSPTQEITKYNYELLEIWTSAIFVIQGAWLMAAFGIAVSMFLSLVPALLMCSMFFILGVIASPLSQNIALAMGADITQSPWQLLLSVWQQLNLSFGKQAFWTLLLCIDGILPNLQYAWAGDALGRSSSLWHIGSEAGASPVYVFKVTAYHICQYIFLLALGAVGLQRKELS